MAQVIVLLLAHTKINLLNDQLTQEIKAQTENIKNRGFWFIVET